MSSKAGGNLRSAMQYAKREAVTHQLNSTSQLLLEQISLPERQPRRFFDEAASEALAASVKARGILQPLLVRPLEHDRFELVAGERRYRAAKVVGLDTVPVFIVGLTDIEAKEAALTENIQREDINPVEETEAILELLALKLEKHPDEIVSMLYARQNEQKGKITHNVMGKGNTELDVFFADIVKMTLASFVTNRLPLLKLPKDISGSLRRGELEYTKALLVARVQEETTRVKLLKRVIEKKLSVGQVRAEIKNLQIAPARLPSTAFEERARRLPELLKRATALEDATTRGRLESLMSEIEAILSNKDTL